MRLTNAAVWNILDRLWNAGIHPSINEAVEHGYRGRSSRYFTLRNQWLQRRERELKDWPDNPSDVPEAPKRKQPSMSERAIRDFRKATRSTKRWAAKTAATMAR